MKSKNGKGSILFGFHFEHWRVIAACMMVYDVLVVNAAYFFALLLRFDLRYSSIPEMYLSPFSRFSPIYTLFCLGIFGLFKLYRSIWQFASYDELVRIIKVSVVTSAFHIIGITLIQRMPISYYLMGSVMQFILILAIRFSYRFVMLLRNHSRTMIAAEGGVPNIMIIGAGSAGQALIRDIHQAKEIKGNVACIIDDDPNKTGRYIDGVEVVGMDSIIRPNRKSTDWYLLHGWL